MKKLGGGKDLKCRPRKSYNKNVREIYDGKDRNLNKRKSINLPKHVNENPLIKIPKRLEKEKDEIIEELKNYRGYKDKEK